MVSSARMLVTKGQMDVDGDVAPPEPPRWEGAGELLLQQGPRRAPYPAGAVTWLCCWTPSCPGLSWGTLAKAMGTPTLCTKCVTKQDLLLLTLLLL